MLPNVIEMQVREQNRLMSSGSNSTFAKISAGVSKSANCRPVMERPDANPVSTRRTCVALLLGSRDDRKTIGICSNPCCFQPARPR